MCQLEVAGLPAFLCAGKRPGSVAEQLTLKQTFRYGGAVDSHKGAILSQTVIVDTLGKQFLSRPALANQKNVGICAAVFLCSLDSGPDPRGFSDNIVKMGSGHMSLAVNLPPDVILQIHNVADILEAHHNPHIGVLNHDRVFGDIEHHISVFKNFIGAGGILQQQLFKFPGKGGIHDLHSCDGLRDVQDLSGGVIDHTDVFETVDR